MQTAAKEGNHQSDLIEDTHRKNNLEDALKLIEASYK